jgi:Xaa-Pro aminopeptidase
MSGSTASAAGGTASLHERTGRLARRLAELELDGLLVGNLFDLRYLAGFTGSSGVAVIAAEPPGVLAGPLFLTDFRYETQSAQQLPATYRRQIASGDLLQALAAALPTPGGRLGFDEAVLSVRSHRRFAEALSGGWELVPCEGEVARLRAVKDEGELTRILEATKLADEALRQTLEGGVVGRSEREVAVELEFRMRRLGAQGPSFESIVAAGPHGALPHAQPREATIPADTLLIIDWGALLEGYCSDCTRTYATGEGISDQEREAYGSVLEAQLAGLRALRPGTSGRDADAAAREVLERAGLGERFGHGLGHGVGLEVHEGPRLARTEADTPLQAGNVVTVEPGVYLPERFGVRIEDLVALGQDTNRVFTGLPKELTVVE